MVPQHQTEQPETKPTKEQVKKTNQVKKPDTEKKTGVSKNQQKTNHIPKPKIDKPKTQLNQDQTVVKTTDQKNVPISKNLQRELENDKKNENNYISAGKIDPFMSPIKKRNAAKAKKVVNRKLSPLEKLDLSQLKLVAVINMQSGKKNIAMVEESSGKGYMVKVGTYIGRNNGRIIEIKNDEIILKERIQNFNGVFEDLIKKMKLQKKDNG